MKTLVIFSLSSTFRPRSVIGSLAYDLRTSGDDVTVLEITDFSLVRQDLPPRWFAKLCGHDVYPQALENHFFRHGIKHDSLTSSSTRQTTELPPLVEKEFETALTSELITYFNTEKPNTRGLFARALITTAKRKARGLYWGLLDYLEEAEFDRVIIPNGRVPEQRMAILACQQKGLDVEYYEIGRAKEYSYYLGKTRVHDREGTQSEVGELTKNLTDDETRSLATSWLEKRTTTGLSIHPYNRRWRSSREANSKFDSNRKIAVFFTSSVDEFASYGDAWNQQTWRDQFEAFSELIRAMRIQNVRCILRLHPNLENKSRKYLRQEMRRVKELKTKFPFVEILSHTDRTSSYELLSVADYVFVGRSTLGLEASCMGKSVWTTTPSRYDQIADVRRIFGPADLQDVGILEPWRVDAAGANRFVSYWAIQDIEFKFGEDNWSTWDSMNAPLRIKIGNLLVRNPLTHKIFLLAREIRTLLNRAEGSRLIHRFFD